MWSITFFKRWPGWTNSERTVPLKSFQELTETDIDVVQEVGAVDVKLAGLLTSLGGLDIF